MSTLEVQQSILNAMAQMSLTQQLCLLEFINAMLKVPQVEKSRAILQFAGVFDSTDKQEIKYSLKDCEQIDEDGW